MVVTRVKWQLLMFIPIVHNIDGTSLYYPANLELRTNKQTTQPNLVTSFLVTRKLSKKKQCPNRDAWPLSFFNRLMRVVKLLAFAALAAVAAAVGSEIYNLFQWHIDLKPCVFFHSVFQMDEKTQKKTPMYLYLYLPTSTCPKLLIVTVVVIPTFTRTCYLLKNTCFMWDPWDQSLWA